MKIIAAALVLTALCGSAQSAELKSDWVINYDTNDGQSGGGDQIIMLGHPLPANPESYTAAPFGPVILSFGRRSATVNEVSFGIYYPRLEHEQVRALPIRFLDSDGGVLAEQQVSAITSSIFVRDVGSIASVEIGESSTPRDLVIYDIRSSRPRPIHGSAFLLTHPVFFQNAVKGTDFETLPDGSRPSGPVSNQWQSIGVVFSDENGENALLRTSQHLPNWDISDATNRPRSGSNGVFSATGTLVITFVDPRTGEQGVVQEAGLWLMNMWVSGIGHPTTAQFLDANGEALETTTSSGIFFLRGRVRKRESAEFCSPIETALSRMICNSVVFGEQRNRHQVTMVLIGCLSRWF
jgi:hypothetical protein